MALYGAVRSAGVAGGGQAKGTRNRERGTGNRGLSHEALREPQGELRACEQPPLEAGGGGGRPFESLRASG